MENQYNNKIPEELLKFRAQIDKIDGQIISLLDERIKIIEQVGEYKKSQKENFFIKSAREADMVRNLAAQANKSIPPSAIVNIWRKIITTANALEQELNIAIYNPARLPDYNYLTKEYYGDFVPLHNYSSITNIIAAIEKGEAQIGVFPLPDGKNMNDNEAENWWMNIPGGKIKVFALFPFVDYQNNDLNPKARLVAAAIKPAEKSTDDKTLWSVEIENSVPKNQIPLILSEIGVKSRILKAVQMPQIKNITFCLVEIDGFLEEKSAQLQAFSNSRIKPFVKVIGHYPTPIKIL